MSEASEAILRRLEVSRRELLDLGGRNRLINTPRSGARSSRLEILDELSNEVFRRLAIERRAMTFLPSLDSDARTEHDAETDADSDAEHDVESDDETPVEATARASAVNVDAPRIEIESDSESNGGDWASAIDPGDATGAPALPQPDDDESDEPAARHTDNQLQTALSDEKLQKRLLKLYYDARTYEEEQGVNILFLALGFLKWTEAESSTRDRFAPLILLPVTLDRRSASAKFRIACTDDEIATNLSLHEKLKADFGISLPELPDVSELVPSDYFATVREAVSEQPEWEVVENDIVLWFFSFSKFLMYRDLTPELWPDSQQLDQHPLLSGLLGDGFGNEPPLVEETGLIDRVLDPTDLIHIRDADSSQAIAIEEVRQGRNLIIQGPPGTGKSQTITNVIATAVRDGRTVLFMAEKMAALDVVKRRLDDVGLGDVCLELHSHKASKKLVLQDIAATLELGRPIAPNIASHVEQLRAERDRLNRHVEILTDRIAESGVTVFEALGRFVRLRGLELAPIELELSHALGWSQKEFQQRLLLVQEVARHVEQTGVPDEHVWRGVETETLLPTDVDRLTRRLPELIERLEQLQESIAALSDTLPGGLPVRADERTAEHAAGLVALARSLSRQPEADAGSFADSVWTEFRADIDALVEYGRTLAECRARLADQVAEPAWRTDVSAARRAIAAHGASWFRIFNSAYRQGMATLRGILKVPMPKPLGDRLELLDTLIEGQRAQQAIEADENRDRIGRRAFGRFWRGSESEWTALAEICNWERNCHETGLPDCFRVLAAAAIARERLNDLIRRVEDDLAPGIAEVDDVFRSVKLNVASAFNRPETRNVAFAELAERLRDWHRQPELARQWIDFRWRWLKLFEAGLAQLAGLIAAGTIPHDEAVDHFQLGYFEALMRQAFDLSPELAGFSGVSHEEVRARFQRLDQTRIELARLEVAISHFESLPRRAGDVGEVGILRREINKKRRHIPLRRLLSEAGRAVQAIKPVFMMSPASVAQFLEPGSLAFDLLVVDEASQVQPVDALGAIARVRQFVVVGDSRQLPPTQFFQKMTDDDAAPEEAAVTRDLESILGFCEARNVPQRMLRWHYRSQHHSLIAVSNQEFYDSRLFVIPSPEIDSTDYGVRFHFVGEGCFDSGRSTTNRLEAERVADAVLEHARRAPERSLGVGAFSVSQRDAILDELEIRRRQHEELEDFFSNAQIEPFFVKNLENIQGDERDVIFISVGYAKNADGRLSMNFGPLSRDGGERRLNVLITRARQRCEVFSSIRGDEIDVSRAKARGAQCLKLFLKYAETGRLEVARQTARGFDSPFEAEVARCLAAAGYRVEPQVGMAGFFIDLAIVDPTNPGRFLIGIECDGASYHSSRWARDRDRLRQAVLESHGWTLHRIWSTDWFHRPEEELRRTIAAIEQARAAQTGDPVVSEKQAAEPPRGPASLVEIKREDGEESDEPEAGHGLSTPYVEAVAGPNTSKSFPEFASSGLERFVVRIVAAEGPIHSEEVVRRVAAHWEIKRVSSKIAERIQSAIQTVTRGGELLIADDFLSVPGQIISIRDRSGVESPALRKPELLPPAEIRVAILEMVRAHFGVARDEVIPEVARLFGFRSTSPALRDRIESQINVLLETGQLLESGTALRLPEMPLP